jgi:hypothetical protein
MCLVAQKDEARVLRGCRLGQYCIVIGPTRLCTGVGINAAVFDSFGTQHVTYVGGDFHIHELLWDRNGWHHHDLTSATSSPNGLNTAIGYVFLCTQHVIYFGGDAVEQLWRDSNGWHHVNILKADGVPAVTFTGRTGA